MYDGSIKARIARILDERETRMYQRRRNPIDTLAGLLVTGVAILLGLSGVSALIFTFGWSILQLYDTLTVWLSA